jgi:phosphorylated CTD-interacting factor 1
MGEAEEGELPEGWTKHYSNSWKKHYYFNSKTGKQSWEPPPPEPKDAGKKSSNPFGESDEEDEAEGTTRVVGAAGLAALGKREAAEEERAAAEKRARAGGDDEPVCNPNEDTPEIGVLRDTEVKKLLDQLRSISKRSAMITKDPGNALTRFLFVARLDPSKEQPDPLIPVSDSTDPNLHRELLKAGMSPEESEEACRKMMDAAQEAAQVIVDFKKKSTRNAASFIPEVEEREWANRQVQIKWKDRQLVINREHYNKLLNLYTQAGSDPRMFRVRLFCLLQRYESIGGTGYQASAPKAVFDCLREEFGVDHECFASPMNCTLPSWGSAFKDTDCFFGSHGSFFDLNNRNWSAGGSFEANPPFVEESMQMMCDCIHQVLQENEERNVKTSFVVVVPCWTDERAHETMRESRFCKRVMILEKSQHSYKSGAQHTSLQQYHDAGFRTTVFVLQNSQGAREWPVTTGVMKKLQECFHKWQE